MKKALKISGIILLILLIAVFSTPFIFKNKILEKVKAEINNNINATVDFSSFDLTIFRSFPNLTIELNELEVIGHEPFMGDTLASIVKTSITVDIMSIISGDQIRIRSVQLAQPRLHLLVLSDGKANWDIVKSGADTAAAETDTSQFKIGLKYYSIKEGYVYYDDASLGFRMEMTALNHEGSGDFTQDLFTLSTKSSIDSFTMIYEGIPYISNAKTKIDADLEMDMVRSKYSFKENEIHLNELVFGLNGFVAMPTDDIDMDLKFDVRKNEFRNFISMVPGMYRDGFDNVKTSGKLSMDGFLKGTYSESSMPGFGLTLIVTDGMLQYPDLPESLNNVNINLKVTNPDGIPDNTLINLSRLHVEIGKDPFDAQLIVKTPVSDADIDATLSGKINMSNIRKLVPLEKGTELSGIFTAELSMKGRMSAIDEKRYQDFNASGNLMLTDFNYKSSDLPQPVSVPVCELIFNPKNVTLNKFEMKTGRTDIKAAGWVDNLIGYMFKENELLKGTMDIKSNVIDLNEFMASETGTADTTSRPMEAIAIPENIDFLLTASAGKIYYDNLILENAKGNVAIRDKALGLNGFSFNMAGGTVSMDGLYESKDIRNPFIFFDLNMTGLDIKQTYDNFIAVQKFAPIAEKCNGQYSASVSVKGNLDRNMSPVMESLTGGGKLSTKSVTLDNFTPLVKVADALKMEQFRKMNINDVNLSFKFENGRVSVEPFDVTLAGIRTTVQGSNGFDQTIDYSLAMKIPTTMMGSAATGVISGLFSKANQAAGTNVNLGKEVNVNVNIGGTVADPKITTSLKDVAAGVTEDVKTQIKDAFDSKKQELEDKAKSEADRMKKEAEDKARTEADRLKKEAEDKARAEAEKVKKEAEEKLKKEAEDKLKNLFGKPKK